MQKILIIKLGALGDVVMATSLIKQIQSHHKNDEIWLLTSPAFKDIFNNWEGIKLATFNRKGINNFFRTLFWIRKKHFDYIYDLQSNDRTSFLCGLSGVSKIIGNHPRFPYDIHPRDEYTGQCHIYERMLQVLESAGIKASRLLPTLELNESEKNHVISWLNKEGLADRKFIIIHAGASKNHPEKCWPYFLELATSLSKAGYIIVWIGSDDEVDLNRKNSNTTGIDASNLFSIKEISELGKHAAFAITNDSGPMHVLSSSGIPVYSFFGPTNWRRNHAINQEKNILSCETLSVITKHDVGPDRNQLSKISVDSVIAKIRHDGYL